MRVCAHVGILFCVRMLVRFLLSIVPFLTLSDEVIESVMVWTPPHQFGHRLLAGTPSAP